MDLEEKTVKKNILYEGKILTLRRDDAILPNGASCSREVVEHSGGVAVLALTEGGVLFVKQFRYPYGEVLLELPAGKLNAGENPLHCGIRELREETGYTAKKWADYGFYYPSPGYTDERIYLYLASELRFEGQQLDEGEFLNVEVIPLNEIVQMLDRNDIKDAKSVIALTKYLWKMARG